MYRFLTFLVKTFILGIIDKHCLFFYILGGNKKCHQFN